MYQDIVDIQQVHIRAARDLFAHGYKLLHIEGTSQSGQHPGNPELKGNNGKNIAGAYFVRRNLMYVMGRTADVEHHDPHPIREAVSEEVTK